MYTLPSRSRWRTRIFGEPLGWGAAEDELLPRRLALPVFASDTLSSVAYAAEAALVVLLAASVASYEMIVPIAIAVSLVMAIVVLSYRSIIIAYPQGGGAFTVATENLGRRAGLVAAAALVVDYLLTATVSVAAAVFAITSAFPRLHGAQAEIALVLVGVLALINLRGLRQTGRAVAIPVYGFIVLVGATLGVGIIQAWNGSLAQAQAGNHLPLGVAASATGIVLMRAFATGCSALTGIEAVTNGVGAFRPPQARNAWTTLAMMAGAAIALLTGVSWLAFKTHALPSADTSVLSQIGRAVWGQTGGGTGFYLLQFFTFAILLLAANTAYQGFPRLLASVAASGSAPRWFQYVGDRLVLSNGVIALSILAAVLLVAFDVRVDVLIHLYLVGVFVAFTLAQAGMLVYWHRRRGTHRRAVARMIVTGVGMVATGTVLAIIMAAKFGDGAWVVVFTIPLLATAAHFTGRHYRGVETAVRAEETPNLLPPAPGAVVVLVDVLDQYTAAAAQAGTLLAADRGRRAVHVGRRDRWDAVSHAWGREPSINVPIMPLATVYGDGPDAVAAHVRAIAEGDGAPALVVLPHPRRSWRPASLRRSLLWRRIRRRLEREPMVAVAQPSQSISGGWWEAESITGLVAMARPYAPAHRALEFARELGRENTWAVHVAGDEHEAKVAESWRDDIPVPLEVVESAYRDLGAPIQAAVHDVVSDEPTTVCLLVVPEVQVTRRRYRSLHNQRTMILRRALAEEERTVLVTLPYPVDV